MTADLDLDQAGAQLIAGPAGALEVLVDLPEGDPVGVAVVAHPQPLLGGSATHKVPQFLARSLAEAGWRVVRPNFRSVGRSEGVHDGGAGEADDLLDLVLRLREDARCTHLALVGFSFGAHVQARVAQALAQRGRAAERLVLAGMPAGEAGGRHYDTPAGLPDALVVHGEADERVPLSAVLAWARPHTQPVVVVPDADHFFTGKLPVLRRLVLAHLSP